MRSLTYRLLTQPRLSWSVVAAACIVLTYCLLAPDPLWFLRRHYEPDVLRWLNDRLEHAAAFAILSGLVAWASFTSAWWPPAWICLTAILAYGAVTELAQSLVANRTTDPVDGLADWLGTCCGWLLVSGLIRYLVQRTGGDAPDREDALHRRGPPRI